ncbi:MAG: ADP-glucose pyrophosphorylase [Firmicutes bacterium]|nr:ADP-glucose pyrophosphorylase [Bacillota bacterium]
MIKNYMGLLILNENEIDIRGLTINRPLASIPIGGRYRIVDFVLSNMVNAGIVNIGAFVQSDSRSLVEHLGTGKPWGLDRNTNGLHVYQYSHNGMMRGDVKMINNNMAFFRKSFQKNVIISRSNMICKVDYEDAIKAHEASGKEMTIIYKRIENADRDMLDGTMLFLDENGLVTGTGINLGGQREANISMEMFLMSKEKLMEFMNIGMSKGLKETTFEMMYDYAHSNDVYAYEYKGYLRRIDSIYSYFNANMDMLNQDVLNELFYKNGRIYTKVKNDPPTKYSHHSDVSNSLLANGCIVDGTVKNSVLARQVKVKKGAVVENSIILQGCVIEENVTLSNVILDKGVIVKKNSALKGSTLYPYIIEKNSVINP